jgi:hypothetical protein
MDVAVGAKYLLEKDHLPIDQHLRSDHQSEETVTRAPRLFEEIDSPIEADDDDTATRQDPHALQAPNHTPIQPTQVSKPRDKSGFHEHSADGDHSFEEIDSVDDAAVDVLFESAASYHGEDYEGSADLSGTGTLTIWDAPKPTGRRQFTVDELRDLQEHPDRICLRSTTYALKMLVSCLAVPQLRVVCIPLVACVLSGLSQQLRACNHLDGRQGYLGSHA